VEFRNKSFLQAIVTAVIIALPVFAYALMLALDASWNAALLELTSRTLSLIPVVNAACTVIFLKPYRQASWSFFHVRRDCKTAPSDAFTVTVKSTTMSISAITDSRPNTKVKFGLASTIYY
jgi:flagellar biosynthesis protein FliQ